MTIKTGVVFMFLEPDMVVQNPGSIEFNRAFVENYDKKESGEYPLKVIFKASERVYELFSKENIQVTVSDDDDDLPAGVGTVEDKSLLNLSFDTLEGMLSDVILICGRVRFVTEGNESPFVEVVVAEKHEHLYSDLPPRL